MTANLQEAALTSRRVDRVGDSLRRLVRRGARLNISKVLGKTRPEDLALLLADFTPAEQEVVFDVLRQNYPDAVGEVLIELEPPLRADLLEHRAPEEIAGMLERIAVDDAVAIVEDLPSEIQEPVLEIIQSGGSSDVREHLTYEEESAGRIMTPQFFALGEDTTVRQAIAAIQGVPDVEMIFYLYVTDAERRLVGITSLRQLLLAAPDRKLAEIMTRSLIKVRTDADQEEVAQLVSRYDLLAIPVVDEAEVLVGIVTVDDIIDILKDEATEDIFKMVGTSDNELLYEARALRVAGIRLPWLLANLVGLVLTGLLLQRFQVSLAEALFLLTFVPVIMGMGGNIGSQTSTIVVRGLATGRISRGQKRIGGFLWQQVKIGALLGLACALVVSLGAWFLESNAAYAVVVGGALFMAITLASLFGAMIPVVFDRFGIDPAVAAGPLVTTSNDITGILIYFGLASIFIELLVR